MHCERGAPVVLGDRLLPARALDLGHGQARETGVEQLHADRLERLMPDVGDDHLHAVTSPGFVAGLMAAPPPANGGAAVSGTRVKCSGDPFIPPPGESEPAAPSS